MAGSFHIVLGSRCNDAQLRGMIIPEVTLKICLGFLGTHYVESSSSMQAYKLHVPRVIIAIRQPATASAACSRITAVTCRCRVAGSSCSTDVLTSVACSAARMAQGELADGWPRSDVKADVDLAPSANEAPTEHGAAADKYYQLLSLHGDTVSVASSNPTAEPAEQK